MTYTRIFRSLALTALLTAPAIPVCAQTDTVVVAEQATVAVVNYSDTLKLSLQQCIDIALSESPTIKVADLEIVRSDYSKKETLAQLLPTVSFGGSYNRMLAKQVMYMNLDDMGGFGGMGGGDSEGGDDSSAAAAASEKKGGDDGIKMGLDNSYQLGFNAAVPLIAPQLWQSLKLSDSQIAQTVEQARSSRLNLVNSVKSAYYALLLAKDSYKTVQQSYDMAKFTHDTYVKQQSVGAASEYDVLRTSVAMKNIEPELTQAEISISRAKLQLQILMGMTPGNYNIDALGQLADYEKTMYADVLALGDDYSANSQLVMNELQTKTLEQSLKVQKMAWYPTLSLSANYNWTSSSNGNMLRNFRWNPYSVLGLTLNVPLFEGGARYTRIKNAEVAVTQAQLQREDLENSVAMQVDLAKENLLLNVKQIASCSESVGEADRAYDIMKRSFDIGAASYLDMRDSELALTRSRLAYYQAIYNYLIAGSELELLLGTAVK